MQHSVKCSLGLLSFYSLTWWIYLSLLPRATASTFTLTRSEKVRKPWDGSRSRQGGSGEEQGRRSNLYTWANDTVGSAVLQVFTLGSLLVKQKKKKKKIISIAIFIMSSKIYLHLFNETAWLASSNLGLWDGFSMSDAVWATVHVLYCIAGMWLISPLLIWTNWTHFGSLSTGRLPSPRRTRSPQHVEMHFVLAGATVFPAYLSWLLWPLNSVAAAALPVEKFHFCPPWDVGAPKERTIMWTGVLLR